MKKLSVTSVCMAAMLLFPFGKIWADAVVATVPVGAGPGAIAVDSVTNKIYVMNYSGNSVTVIDGATNDTTNVAVGNSPSAITVNPVTNKIYVANSGSSNVTVIDGATNATTTVSTDSNPKAVTVNPVTNKIYVANSKVNGTVTVIDGSTNATVTVAAGNSANLLAVDPVTNKIYIGGDTNFVTVLDGATNKTTAVVFGPTQNICSGGVFCTNGANNIAVNAVTNKIYLACSDGNIKVIDGATNDTATVMPGNWTVGPRAVVVNPATNMIYVLTFEYPSSPLRLCNQWGHGQQHYTL